MLALASILGPRAAHSPNAQDIHETYWIALVVTTILAAAIIAAVLVAVVRFRDRRGRAPRRIVAGRGAFRPAAAVLTLVAVGLLIVAIIETDHARTVEPTGPEGLGASRSLTAQVGGLNLPAEGSAPLEIRVVGQQWLWRFDYPTTDSGGSASAATTSGPPYDVFTFNELVVPVDTTVVLDVTSIDVAHRWFVPALGGQVDAIPGQTSQTWFRADETGVYPGQSMAYSGAGYPAMRAWVRVVSPEAYEAFVRKQEAEIKASQEWVTDHLQGVKAAQ